MRGHRLALFALALCAACGDAAPQPQPQPQPMTPCLDEAALSGAPRPLPVGDFPIDPDGRSAPAQIPLGPPEAAAVLLRLLPGPGLPPAACLQIHSLGDGAGRPWVTPPASRNDLGLYCRSCPERVTVAVGGGTYVLPSADASAMDRVAGPLTLRGALRDCETFLSARPGPGQAQHLRVEALGLAPVAPDRRGVLPVEVLITPASSFADPANQATLTAAFALLNQELDLAQAGVSVAVLRRHVLPAAPDPLEFTAGDHGALRGLTREARCPDQAVAPIVLAGCLRLRDPVLGRTDEPEGYASHVPGGAGDGVFIKGRTCAGSGTPLVWPESLLAKVLLHELGHFLGLYHAVEQDGTPDTLSDTGPDNLMHFRPTTEGARGLTPAQVRVLRRHPFIRYSGSR